MACQRRVEGVGNLSIQNIVSDTSKFPIFALPCMNTTTSHREQKPIGLPLLFLQMAVSAVAFMVVMPTMALVMPPWELGKRLVSYARYRRTMQRNSVVAAYYRSLRHLLTEEAQGSFKEEHERPPARISQLIRQLDQATPSFTRQHRPAIS